MNNTTKFKNPMWYETAMGILLLAIIGAVFFLVFLPFVIIKSDFVKDAGIVLFIFIALILIGMRMIFYGKYLNLKIKRLKENGIRYDLEIVNVSTDFMMGRFMNYVPASIVGEFQNQNGEICRVASKYFLLEYFTWLKLINKLGEKNEMLNFVNKSVTKHNNISTYTEKNSQDILKAYTYVNQGNKNDYVVEILLKL